MPWLCHASVLRQSAATEAGANSNETPTPSRWTAVHRAEMVASPTKVSGTRHARDKMWLQMLGEIVTIGLTWGALPKQLRLPSARAS